MIELALWRARVGCFLNKKLIKSPRSFSQFSNIQLYILLLLLISLNKRIRRIKSTFFITFIILFYISYFNNTIATEDKVFSFCLDCSLIVLSTLSVCIENINKLNNLKLIITYLLLCAGDIHQNPGPTPSFNIAHLNARSITALRRVSEVRDLILDFHKINILCLTETHLDDSVRLEEIDFPGYTWYRKDRNRNGGGVAILCQTSIPSKRRQDLESANAEMVWVEININNLKFIIGTCYRPPGQSAYERDQFLSYIETSVDSAIGERPVCVLLLGDFNDRCTSWHDSHSNSEIGHSLYNLCNSLHMHQLITEPTRGTNLLDLFFTDRPDLFSNTAVLPPINELDHCTIISSYNHTYEVSQSYLKTIWHYDRGNYLELNNYLNTQLVHENLRNKSPLEVVNYLTNTITNGMELHIPSKTIRIKQRDKPWFTPRIRKLFQACYKLHKRKNKTNLPAHILEYQIKHREAKNAFRTAKNNYYLNIASDLQNPETTSKSFWTLLKSVFNKNSSGIPALNNNGMLITDNQHKANLLNDYFASQSILPPSNVTLPDFHYVTDARLDHITFTPESVKDILLNLNTSKSVGPDSINNILLKNCANTLCHPLSYIFQLCLDLGIFPDSWKEALITALFKKLDPSIVKNYRPISLLNTISKIYEKAVFDKVYPYLLSNKLLSPFNSGFIKLDGAINRLIAMIDSIHKGFDDRENSLLISLDISKAFDRVWHQGLLFKLKQCGITGNLLAWFQSYLTNRRQRVRVGGKLSNTLPITSGVPQGSILGPILFLVYVRDMCEGLTSNAHQFADDITLIYHFTNPILASTVVNSDLHKIQLWAEQWRVTFNPDKTFFLLMSLKKLKPIINNIFFCNKTISESNHITTLGLTICNNLNWDMHIKNLIHKASKRLIVLKKHKWLLPRVALEKIYIAMIRPILEYGHIIYDNCSSSAAQSLENLQRQAAIAYLCYTN